MTASRIAPRLSRSQSASAPGARCSTCAKHQSAPTECSRKDTASTVPGLRRADIAMTMSSSGRMIPSSESMQRGCRLRPLA